MTTGKPPISNLFLYFNSFYPFGYLYSYFIRLYPYLQILTIRVLYPPPLVVQHLIRTVRQTVQTSEYLVLLHRGWNPEQTKYHVPFLTQIFTFRPALRRVRRRSLSFRRLTLFVLLSVCLLLMSEGFSYLR